MATASVELIGRLVAEKAADLTLGNTPLAPATVPFYRHQPNQQASDQEPAGRS